MEPTPPEVSREHDVTVVSLGPDYDSLDEDCLHHVQDDMLEAAENAEPPDVLIDLSYTTFFGSGFIAVLLRVRNRINRRGGRFALCGLHSYCAEVLHTARLDTLW